MQHVSTQKMGDILMLVTTIYIYIYTNQYFSQHPYLKTANTIAFLNTISPSVSWNISDIPFMHEVINSKQRLTLSIPPRQLQCFVRWTWQVGKAVLRIPRLNLKNPLAKNYSKKASDSFLDSTAMESHCPALHSIYWIEQD